tara:strand:+ start:187 stop:1011 length:825 start_codon:yes stop_codon:yes gene_type:complete
MKTIKIKPKEISSSYNPEMYQYEFSFCTLVNDQRQYQQLLTSCEKAGFNETNSEFFYLDNQEKNTHDGYTGLNKAIHVSRGKYIILIHQDVRLEFDTINDLKKRIKEIEIKDHNWAVLGNAGGNNDLGKKFIRISDPANKNLSFGNIPAKVHSLDENFMVIKSSSNLAFSNDMHGYHFYGTDLCQQADFRGYSCYVIDFHLLHLSSGNKDLSYFEAKKRFLNNYHRKLSARFLRTTTCRIFLSSSRLLNLLFNQKDFLFLLRKTKIYKLFGQHS